MKLKYALAVFAVSLAMSSCVKDPEVNAPLGGGEENFAPDKDNIFPGWVRIKLSEDAPALRTGAFTRGAVESGDAEMDRVAEMLGATEIRRVFNEGGKYAERRRRAGLHLWYDIKIDGAVSRAQSAIAEVPYVVHTQPIYKLKSLAEPILSEDVVYIPSVSSVPGMREASELPFNDKGLAKQWHYHNDGSMENTVAGADIGLFEGWKITTGSPNVIVAVIDSGIEWDHPDLADAMWVNEAELNGTQGVDDDGNGYIDDIYGYSYVPRSEQTIKGGTHGTHVAGTIGAVNNNKIGVCGIAGGDGENPGVRLMSIEVMTDTQGVDVDFADAFAYAADNGAVITNCSWVVDKDILPEDIATGIDYFNTYAGTDESGEVQVGPVKGGLCIFGAGNDGKDWVYYPAKDPRVVGVSAITADYKVAAYSNYGDGLDLMAPGGGDNYGPAELQVYSTYTGHKYAYSAGTSMATPHVTGVAALIASKFQGPGFTAAELRSRLERSFRPTGQYFDPIYHNKVGRGLVDASLILTEVPAEGPGPLTEIKAVPAGAAVNITTPVPVDGNGMPVMFFNLRWAEVVNGTPEEMQTMVLNCNYDAGEEFVYVFEGKSETPYVFQVNAVDRYGNETAYVDLEATTLIFDNHAPELLRPFADVEIQDADVEKYTRTYTLGSFFKDPDAKYGDVISYDVKCSDERIVNAYIKDGVTLVIEPKAKGSCVVTVIATDTRDGVTEAPINVTVLNGPDPNGGGTDPDPDPDPDPEYPGGLSLWPNPVVDVMNIHVSDSENAAVEVVVYDSAAREVVRENITLDEDGNNSCDLEELAPGMYSVKVVSDNGIYNSTIVKR